ncbi:hypothetical protein BALAC2494_01789 [Bifidobacterium animalis subsp. lactis CNCM I-2494]|uniref:Uncharacterized protein n=1 Tax=Bifidobacterium animalis subsp. lactis CNCM I-2494 TaxID=1042403 RepID=A0A806FGG9_BIFAN|nr:hypothetical protein BALAC2494_01789 [Bifidobacterium animalis subsp. lactis CNCM I-2494]AXM93151.1 hypothetical protein CJD49_02135 [Bifidobacterium animalis subsp. lactis]
MFLSICSCCGLERDHDDLVGPTLHLGSDLDAVRMSLAFMNRRIVQPPFMSTRTAPTRHRRVYVFN